MEARNLTYFFRAEEDFQRYIKEKNLDSKTNKNEPLFDYKFLNFTLRENYEILIFTSRMSIKSFLQHQKNDVNRNIKIIIIGEKSAELLKQNNFQNIIFISENVEKIISFIKKNSLENKKICYLRGNFITTDLRKIFPNIDEIFSYEIFYKNDFSENFLNDLLSEKILNLKFFSYKSMEEFLKICTKENILEHLKNINAFTINEKSKYIFDKNIFQSVNIFSL